MTEESVSQAIQAMTIDVELCQICGIGKQSMTCEDCGEVVCPECIRETEEGSLAGCNVCSECDS